MLTLEELSADVASGAVDTVIIAMCDMQGRLQGKRLHARAFVDGIAEHGAEGCNYLLAVDVDMNTVPGYAMSSWERGYGDFVFMPDLATLRRIPWLEGTVMVQCDLLWHDGSPVAASPRQVLRGQLERARRARLARLRGLRARVHPVRRDLRLGAREGLARAAARQRLQRRLLDPRHDDGRAACCARSGSAWRAPGCSSRTPRASATSASTRSTSATRRRCGWPTTTSSTATAPRRSRSCTARRSRSCRSSTSARATRATSTSASGRAPRASSRRPTGTA